jgi:pSer/pThr/pTyr-binding forkhead associated (FHA) protein
VRGKRIRRHRLAVGDVVKIGQHELTYSRVESKAATTVTMDDRDDPSDDDEGSETEEERDA